MEPGGVLTRRMLLAAASTAMLPFGARAAEDWGRVEQDARKEGRLTIYNGLNFRVVRQIATPFEKKYGVQVDILAGRASEIRERIRAEQAAGRYIGDLHFNGVSTLGWQKTEGMIEPHGWLPSLERMSSSVKADGTILPVMIGTFAILVNTRMVKPDQQPKSWKDLLDPRWTGKLLCDDPRAVGAGSVWFEVMLDAFGRSFHETFAERKPVFSRQFAENQRRVARGEYPLYVPFNISETGSVKGLPVAPIVPTEGLPYQPFSLALLKKASHPNAARLFMNWALGDEAQLMFAAEGLRPAVDGIDASIPPDIRPVITAKLLGTTSDWVRQNELLKMAAEIYH